MNHPVEENGSAANLVELLQDEVVAECLAEIGKQFKAIRKAGEAGTLSPADLKGLQDAFASLLLMLSEDVQHRLEVEFPEWVKLEESITTEIRNIGEALVRAGILDQSSLDE